MRFCGVTCCRAGRDPSLPTPGHDGASPRTRRAFLTAVRILRYLVFLVACAATYGKAGYADSPSVVVSIKPIHSLVAGVMEGVGQPSLLLEGRESPHFYALRPSDALALKNADLVVWIGQGLETFLTKPLATLPDNAEILEIAKIEGLTLLDQREGGIWDGHEPLSTRRECDNDDCGQTDDHAHGVERGSSLEHANLHLWLDPWNARLMIAAIAGTLARIDPEHADSYAANAARRTKEVEDLDRSLESRLSQVKDRRFVVFHDAYQYLESRYNLSAVGAIVVGHESPSRARRISEIRDRIAEGDIDCLFVEPQFPQSLVDTIVEDTQVRVGTIDPIGAGVDAGPEAYSLLMGAIADSLVDCLVTTDGFADRKE